ncbi:MAG: LD-carboxypeptidase [Polynucleobacter sp. 24-46-87]|uniref:LD-carboxypeptidase n=1 Tax=unclassified Polynucleobacter TaxID=2640945 RepID=UPI000BC87DD7|nr:MULTISPECIES: LD-carboxypeptidase [unclassified Polynucleobacter]OYY21439.1 MAG: LD-carboxypeptidase [Polynucleobacter sp. 35-46-11]OZA15598.1 MAG: LD-carboxypeptidase [Polynucleobacter sp. 24-46-87]OZA77238.1 MAG: LD-carboxypeptidase [Polynucleobacter sp. 39-46-10]
MKQIHLIAPSGASLDPRSPLAGIEWLKQQGIEVLNIACVNRIEQRFAGSDAERLAEMNQLAELSPEIAVVAMRGGYGLLRLLPDIEWDAIASAIKDGLQICGHSDFTVFQLGLLAKTGAVTLAGPMLNFDFACQGEQGDSAIPNAFMWTHFQKAINERKLDCTIEANQAFLKKSAAGQVSGMLWGGNLTVLAGLVGTPYLPSKQQTQGGILFLEDVNEHPYRIERMLMQLLDAGILSNQSAILLGGFSAYRLYDNDRGYTLESAIEAIGKRLPDCIPILTGLPFGHQAEKMTLPVGAQAHVEHSVSGFTIQSQW